MKAAALLIFVCVNLAASAEEGAAVDAEGNAEPQFPAHHQRDRIPPEIRGPLEGLVKVFGPRGLTSIANLTQRRATLLSMIPPYSPSDKIIFETRNIPGPEGAPDIRINILRPASAGHDDILPVIFQIHGGGMIMGSPEFQIKSMESYALANNAVVVLTSYRLAPENPYPAGVTDCYTSLSYVAEHAEELRIDPTQIVLYGGSAGGNLVIATALKARDLGSPAIKFVMSLYPMIDDRHNTPSSHEITDLGLWDRATNIEAWQLYLGDNVMADQYAAPARANDLSGLPPMYIDVGTLDVFRDENIDFAQRLAHQGVPIEFHLFAGAYHASEVFAPMAELSKRMIATRYAAMKRALTK